MLRRIKDFGFVLWVFRYVILAVVIGAGLIASFTAIRAWFGDPMAVWWACDIFGYYCP